MAKNGKSRKEATPAKQEKPEKEKKPSKKTSILSYALYLVLILSIIGYIFSGNSLFGALAFILVILAIAFEFGDSFRTIGVKKTLAEVALAIALAVALIWLLPSLILHTSSPIDVVASCSMLPVLHRGDLVALHSISNMSAFLKAKRIPIVNVSKAAYNGMLANMQSEFLEPFAYSTANPSKIYTSYNALANQSIGFYNLRCIASLSAPRYGECLVRNQSSNLIQYHYSLAIQESSSGINSTIPYVSSITIDNHTIAENYSNPIIVYKTTRYDYFTGDIIHRLVAALNVSGSYYTLTKGDNNPVLDMEALNYPSNSSNVVGYVVSDVRYLGFLSLIIRGQIAPVAGCNQTITRN